MDKISFVCETCKYKFLRDRNWGERVCPYCGRKNSVHEELSVADLIEDLDRV